MKLLPIIALATLLAVGSAPSLTLAADQKPAAAVSRTDRAQAERALRSASANSEFTRALVNGDQRALQQLYNKAGGQGDLTIAGGGGGAGPAGLGFKVCLFKGALCFKINVKVSIELV